MAKYFKEFRGSLMLVCAICAGVNLVNAQNPNDAKNKKVEERKNEEFTCPEEQGNGNYADPATCRRFYQCVDGYPYLNRCPSGLYFDDISKFCTFKDEARCGPILTKFSRPLLTLRNRRRCI